MYTKDLYRKLNFREKHEMPVKDLTTCVRVVFKGFSHRRIKRSCNFYCKH